uniref:PTN_MK_C domain-containing protein n=1 Tax=Steinernema glaseri TaxID=37863 RepID=A0A1I8AFB1_9BILA
MRSELLLRGAKPCSLAASSFSVPAPHALKMRFGSLLVIFLLSCLIVSTAGRGKISGLWRRLVGRGKPARSGSFVSLTSQGSTGARTVGTQAGRSLGKLLRKLKKGSVAAVAETAAEKDIQLKTTIRQVVVKEIRTNHTSMPYIRIATQKTNVKNPATQHHCNIFSDFYEHVKNSWTDWSQCNVLNKALAVQMK